MRGSRGLKGLAIGIGAVVVCGAIAICGYFFIAGRQVASQLDNAREDNADIINSIVNSVGRVFETDAGSARVYDCSDTYLFTIRGGTPSLTGEELSDSLRPVLLSRVLNGRSPRLLVDSDWTDAMSPLGKLRGVPRVEEVMTQSIGAAAVDTYCRTAEASTPTLSKFILARALEEKFTTEQLLVYCSTQLTFNGVTGLAAAADTFFNLPVEQLSEPQVEYLKYVLDKENVSWSDYVEAHPAAGLPESATLFGLVAESVTSDKDPMRAAVREELATLLGTRLDSEAFDVRLYFDTKVTAKLLDCLDTAMAPSISLQSDGQTTLDGTVQVVDPKTAGVIAFVSGRTVNKIPKTFNLPTQSTLGNYQCAKEYLIDHPDLTYNKFIEYVDAEGKPRYVSLEDAVVTSQLPVLGVTPTLENRVSLNELSSFMCGLYSSGTPHFVQQITEQGSDKQIYVDKVATPTINDAANVNMRAMLAESLDDTVGIYKEEYPVGYAFANITDGYILSGVLGSDALGYSLSYDDMDLLRETAAQLSSAMESLNRVTLGSLDSGGVLTDRLAEVEEENLKSIQDLVTEWVTRLRDMTIASVDDRRAFELELAQAIAEVQKCQRVLGPNAVSQQKNRLQQVRIERSNELMQYVA